MRKFKLLLISVLFPCMCMGEGAHHEDNEFIIRAGFTGSHLRYKDNIGGTVNVSYIPFEINSCGIGWNANFTKTKDYYSISPLGATATLLTFLGYTVSSEMDSWIRTVLFCMAAESMGLYIPIGKNFELQPYWSLLRLSKWQKEKILITGAFGLAATVYIKKFSITAYGEYSYGYGNSDWWGETLSNVFTDAEDTYYNRYEKPCTPFKGWIYGVTLGFSFNL